MLAMAALGCGSSGGSNAGGDAGGNGDHPDAHSCTTTAFSPAPASFALPTGYSAGSFADLSGGNDCQAGADQPRFALVDLTGDGKPDIVVSQTCGDATVGVTHWLVYANSGSGFATSPTNFALPTGYSAGSFDDLSGGNDCQAGADQPRFALVDLTG